MVISEVLVLIYGRRISLPSRSYDDITSSQCSGCGFCIFFLQLRNKGHIYLRGTFGQWLKFADWQHPAVRIGARLDVLATICFFFCILFCGLRSDVLLWCLGDDNSDGNQTSPGRRNRTCFHDNGMYIISDGTTTQILCKFLYIIFTVRFCC